MRAIAVQLVGRLQKAGYQACFVGGCVRDQLIGIDIKDYDIATSAVPQEIRAVFSNEKLLEVGAAFGIVMLVKQGHVFEIATFRGEGGYADGRRPLEIYFTGLQEDASRRDFTMNALYYDPFSDHYYDFFCGREDIAAKIVRCVGDASSRFAEDHLRLLRAVRFAVEKQFDIESETLCAISKHAPLIVKVSAERRREELNRILASSQAGRGIRLLHQTSLFEPLFLSNPGIDDIDVIARGLDADTSGLLLVRFALVLQRLTSSTIVDLRYLQQQFKFDKKFMAEVLWLLRALPSVMQWNSLAPHEKFDMAVHPLFAGALFALLFAMAAASSQPSARLHCEHLVREHADMRQNQSERFAQAERFTVITGNDLAGVLSGPQIGEALKRARQHYLNGELEDRAACLAFVASHFGGGR